ncbi:hypothetical protein YPPY64_1901, partial [Yersinia pestis PY-64]
MPPLIRNRRYRVTV